jgi:hypothetical protein
MIHTDTVGGSPRPLTVHANLDGGVSGTAQKYSHAETFKDEAALPLVG